MREFDSGVSMVVPGWALPGIGPEIATPTADRRDGRTLVAQFEAALRSKPAYLLFHSWNEHDTGTAIEPSPEYGNFYSELALALLRKAR
jgi:hypothetical protein